jgi:hypothetical protein
MISADGKTGKSPVRVSQDLSSLPHLKQTSQLGERQVNLFSGNIEDHDILIRKITSDSDIEHR